MIGLGHVKHLTLSKCLSGTGRWLWYRCLRWRRPSRPWLAFITTTWEPTSTSECPSPSRPFEEWGVQTLSCCGLQLRRAACCLDCRGTTYIFSVRGGLLFQSFLFHEYFWFCIVLLCLTWQYWLFQQAHVFFPAQEALTFVVVGLGVKMSSQPFWSVSLQTWIVSSV